MNIVKKTTVFLFALSLMLCMTACNRKNNGAVSSAEELLSSVIGDVSGVVSGSSMYVDGTYRAQMPKDSYGYTEYMVIEVKNGDVTVKEFDAFDDKNNLKSEDDSYMSGMQSATGTYPKEVYTQLIRQFNNTRDVDAIDSVSGATTSSENFKTMLRALLDKKAKTGNTETLLIEQK